MPTDEQLRVQVCNRCGEHADWETSDGRLWCQAHNVARLDGTLEPEPEPEPAPSPRPKRQRTTPTTT